MIKPENYKRIKVKLVKCQNKDPRVINEKCMCQNGRKVISRIANKREKNY